MLKGWWTPVLSGAIALIMAVGVMIYHTGQLTERVLYDEDRIEKLELRVREFSSQDAQIEFMKESLGKLETQIGALSQQDARITRIEVLMSTKFDHLDDRFDQLNTRFDQLERHNNR